MNWNIKIQVKLGKEDLSFDLTASEERLLTMLRSFYLSIETKVREIIKAGAFDAPAGLLDEVLLLVRCLVFNRLEPLNGKHIKIIKVQ